MSEYRRDPIYRIEMSVNRREKWSVITHIFIHKCLWQLLGHLLIAQEETHCECIQCYG